MALDRLEAMRAFCHIIEKGSFTAAAESLHVAKTTISGQVQTLEGLLGVKLLHRTTRKVAPTTAGSAYYQRARAVIDDLDELEASVSQNQNEIRGWVRVEMPSPVGVLLVLPALPLFHAKYPDIHLNIGCGERILDLHQDGVDCAIRGGKITQEDLVCRQIGQMKFCLCASPDYLRLAGHIHTPDDLNGHKHIGYKFPGTDKRYIPTITRGNSSVNLDFPAFLFLNDAGAIKSAAIAGLGIAFLPRAECQPHFISGILTELLPDWQMASMPISLVYPYTRHLSAKVRVFTDWITELTAQNPLWSL